MKKVVFAFAASLVMMSCGGNASEAVVTDSTAVDSTLVADSSVVATDTTVAEIGEGGAAQHEQPVK
jgi:hypothetical protein